MSGSLAAWYSLDDLGILAARQAALVGEIELRQMARLRDLLESTGGSVKAGLQLRQRHEGYVTAELSYQVELVLRCQRCLEPLRMAVDERVQLAITQPEGEACVPAEYEPVTLEGERLRPADLIEDELIIALPLVPKHAADEDCGVQLSRAPRGRVDMSLD